LLRVRTKSRVQLTSWINGGLLVSAFFDVDTIISNAKTLTLVRRYSHYVYLAKTGSTGVPKSSVCHMLKHP
jgi:hypothetical protein